MTNSNTTRVLGQLEGKGLITRSSQKGDRRLKCVQITQKGIDLIGSLQFGYQKRINRLLSAIDHKQQKVLSELLAELLHHLKNDKIFYIDS